MVTVKNPSQNILELHPEGPLKTQDVEKVVKMANELILQHGSLKILVVATNFSGWKDVQTAEEHFQFVKTHHKKVEKIALITGHTWQKWVAVAIKTFLHPVVKVFEPNDIEAAKKWLNT